MPIADLTIRVQSRIIRSRPDVDEPGLYIKPDGFSGWDGTADVRRESVERPGEDGEFDLPVYSGARVVKVDGVVLADSLDSLGWWKHHVMGIGAGGVRFRVEVDHHGETLWAWARRGGQAEFTDSGIRSRLLHAGFFQQWVFPDPRKYGETNVSTRGTTVQAYHRGNAPVSPVVEVTGPFPNGYTVTAAGRTLTVTAPLPAGSVDRIEIGRSRLFRNGSRLLGAISVPGRWAIPGGVQVTHALTGAGGSGSMVVRTLDAFE
ncbi:hypothetical protein [Microbacterium sp. XT11]|uniref:hypothetical protein n=1 Tax=Microbacterium sp. XT11 TaxID=367477 RepID=UPI000831B6AE|nr:hypothetical protein [Microbacterium sp. XT11]